MDSFDAIYEKYYKKIYVFLYRLAGNEALVEEMTQEALYKAFLHIDQYKGKCSLFTWLCQIAKNTWLTEQKRHKRFQPAAEEWDPPSGYDLEDEVIRQEMLRCLRREIAKLPEPYLSVCALKIYAEQTFADIAANFGKSESWARVTFHRGKRMLIERMGESNEGKA